MDALPFGQTVLVWRLNRGLTQEALARRARIPRPNLSAVERGRREVSLTTLRALAEGLGVRPGVLVDGVAPSDAASAPKRWSREALERVAEAVVRNVKPRDPQEHALATTIQQVIRNRLDATRGRGRPIRRDRRRTQGAWLQLETAYPREVIRSLLQRIEDRWVRA